MKFFRPLPVLIASLLPLLASVAPAQPAGPARPPTRPVLAEDELKRLAAELRAVYAKPSAEWPKPDIDEGVAFVELGVLPPVVHPADNPYSRAKADLGKTLFFDPRLSGTGQMACASCHDPDLGWADGRTVAFGHSRKELKRNAPTVINAGYQSHFFWDGRATTLEDQALAVIANPDEMRNDGDTVVARLQGAPEYRKLFGAAFGEETITLARVGQALATFERTLVSGPNKFDAFVRGKTEALSDAAVRGLHLFRTTARCANCHHGPNFTDGRFHNLGLSQYGRPGQDLGRYQVTQDVADVGAFKTPTLRNVLRTAPYMHTGLFDLETIPRFYNNGGLNLRRTAAQKDDPLFPTKSALLRPLGLNSRDMDDLIAFLDALSESRARTRVPELPAGQ